MLVTSKSKKCGAKLDKQTEYKKIESYLKPGAKSNFLRLLLPDGLAFLHALFSIQASQRRKEIRILRNTTFFIIADADFGANIIKIYYGLA